MARVKKYIFTPATAEEIQRAVGVTRADSAIVAKVLKELGFIEPSVAQEGSPLKHRLPTTVSSRGKAAPAAKRARTGKGPGGLVKARRAGTM